MSLYQSGLNRRLEGQDALPDLLLAQATSRKLVRQQTALGFPERDRRFSVQIIKRRGAALDIAGPGDAWKYHDFACGQRGERGVERRCHRINPCFHQTVRLVLVNVYLLSRNNAVADRLNGPKAKVPAADTSAGTLALGIVRIARAVAQFRSLRRESVYATSRVRPRAPAARRQPGTRQERTSAQSCFPYCP
ncbi:hypothetical protein ACVJBD_004113 [Rhizobium mongolense]